MIADAVLDRLAAAVGAREGRGRDADLAKVLGVAPKLLATWRSRGSYDHDLVIRVAHERGVSLDWLLTGEGTARQTATAVATLAAEPRLPSYQVDPSIAEAMQTAPIVDAGDAVARLRTLHSATAEVIEWMERQMKVEG